MSMTATLPGQATGPPAGPVPAGPDVSAGLERRLCVVAAQRHCVEAELVGLLAACDDVEGWAGPGIRSLGHWAAINLGVSAPVAAAMASAGRRLRCLPAVSAAAAAGVLGWDKVRLVTSVAEPEREAFWLGLAREMSVTQLARFRLGRGPPPG